MQSAPLFLLLAGLPLAAATLPQPGQGGRPVAAPAGAWIRQAPPPQVPPAQPAPAAEGRPW
ncbi:hypothetical protein [Roseomonas haemaphysalidis]|uniref:Uncharacterized protein n=1 Tax=Roseomonas haemaphysalidis TaxID=2768162 RepID=A0ABS3KMA9_9PROT|nr:hypothetical protein [Roseomonas haemaphysalidis]MBO1078607.1 hypothetical protein [Roseomonas haemaphysalidis]